MKLPEKLPLVALKGTVVFPRVVTPIMVGRERSVAALDAAVASHRMVLLVTQKEAEKDDLEPEDLYPVGTVAFVGQMLKLPNGTVQILVHGQSRARIKQIAQTDPYFEASFETVQEDVARSVEADALMRMVLSDFQKFVEIGQKMPPEIAAVAENVREPNKLVDLIASYSELAVEDRQTLLETIPVAERMRLLHGFLSRENEVLELKNKIQSELQKGMEKTQREYILREQMKAIQRELGDNEPQVMEANDLRDKIAAAGMPEEVEKKALKEASRLEQIPPMSPEVGMLRTYLDWLVSMPWATETPDNLNLKEAEEVLEEEHYGLSKVKQRILEYLAVRQLAGKDLKSPILCFVGPPGVGKTSLGRSIARALGRKYVRMSLGGVRDEAEIRGHRRTYIGALPGRIIQNIKQAGTKNPVFILDEIDKVGADFRGDPTSALLEVLDPEQNKEFQDHYLEAPFDLSDVMFITTANLLDTIPSPLRDRMEIINVSSYTQEEKLHIATGFLVPKQLKANGIPEGKLTFTEEGIRRVAQEYTREAGVRNLEREIGSICRKVARGMVEGKLDAITITAENVPEYLGPARFLSDMAKEDDEVGVATGVAVTESGGELIPVEVTIMDGRGDFLLTGQLGQVMQESARAALSYARSRSDALGVLPEFFDNHMVHLHVPAGAIPKDGPSAGITMGTALVSALTARPIRKEVAMTGEVTLRGRVLPIGGLKEKALAAFRAGCTTFILPDSNAKDLVDVPQEVRDHMSFIPVKNMDDVLRVALLEPKENRLVIDPIPADQPIPAATGPVGRWVAH
ncbi:MAG TPA: endopeptidase La [Armatimonadota bacterium]|nr:endopeptidase La [Armatimonadota bacterium]